MNKKIFTILLTLGLVTIAFAQVPMVVKGQMKNVGDMKSRGSVELRASEAPGGKMGEIINHGNLVLGGGLSFGSNDNTDGMLFNDYSKASVAFSNIGNGNHKNVKIEKVLKLGQWYYLSFPFDIKISDIVVNATDQLLGTLWNKGQSPINNTSVLRIVKDSDKRVQTGQATDQWQYITSNDDVLEAGKGYGILIAISPSSSTEPKTATIILPAMSEETVNNLYNSVNFKKITYTYYHDQFGQYYFSESTKRNTEGWAILGTKYTHNYFISNESVSIPDVFGGELDNIYIHKSGPGGGWIPKPLDPGMGGYEPLNLSPYTPFFVWLGIDDKAIKETVPNKQEYYNQHKHPSTHDNVANFHKSKSNTIVNSFVLYFQADNSELSDKLWVVEAERYKNYLRPGQDAAKLFSSDNVFSQFYTLYQNELPLAIHTFHNIDQDIPLGMKLMNEANYTIRMGELRGFEDRDIYLLDNGIMHKLSESEYTFHAPAGTCDDRFVLRVASTPTEINLVASGIRVWAQNKTIFVQGVQSGDRVSVYDVAGKLLQQNIVNNNEVSYPLGQAGIFVVKVNGYNNIVTKVISK